MLTNLLTGVRLGEGAHVLEIGPPRHIRELASEVARETVDHLRIPAVRILPGEDLAPNLPIEAQKFTSDRERGPDLRIADPRLEVLQKRRNSCGTSWLWVPSGWRSRMSAARPSPM